MNLKRLPSSTYCWLISVRKNRCELGPLDEYRVVVPAEETLVPVKHRGTEGGLEPGPADSQTAL